MGKINILVIGDSCIDEFIYCDIERICPEAPVPVLKPIRKKQNPGMALNVVENLKSLDAKIDIITNKDVIKKTRYVDARSGQMVLRVDKNDSCKRYKGSYITSNYDAIIISDYCKGFLTKNDIKNFIENSKCLTFLDTKKQLGEWCSRVNFIKINEFEYQNNIKNISNNPDLKNKLIITRGSKGCEYKDKLYPVPKVSIKDVSGAGDTFLSGLVVKYLETNNIKKSIKFANECSTIVVQKSGVAII